MARYNCPWCKYETPLHASEGDIPPNQTTLTLGTYRYTGRLHGCDPTDPKCSDTSLPGPKCPRCIAQGRHQFHRSDSHCTDPNLLCTGCSGQASRNRYCDYRSIKCVNPNKPEELKQEHAQIGTQPQLPAPSDVPQPGAWTSPQEVPWTQSQPEL